MQVINTLKNLKSTISRIVRVMPNKQKDKAT